jgi:hypothetical protein
MNCRFNISKVTQVAAAFATREGGTINIMKLVKLAYLLDRLSLDRRGIPVLGGNYFSMPNGPVISELLDLINSGDLYGFETDWGECFSSRCVHDVSIERDAGTDKLSPVEIGMINEIYTQHGNKDQFRIRDWCHVNLPEWHPVTQGRKEISVEDILEALGKTPDEIKETVRDEEELKYLDSMLS